jgi:hypothetical protein
MKIISRHILLILLIVLASEKANSINSDSLSSAKLFLEIGLGVSDELAADQQNIYPATTSGFSLSSNIGYKFNSFFGCSLESGFIRLSHYSDENNGIVNMTLNAIPIQANVIIYYSNFHLSASYGMYNLLSNLNALGDISQSSSWNDGYSASLAYTYYLTDSFYLSGEFEYIYITNIDRNILRIQVYFGYGI